MYANARYYEHDYGRWLSQDPVFLAVGNDAELESKTGLRTQQYLADPQGLNGYSYARNNPLKFIDPDGNNPVVAFLLVLLSPRHTSYDPVYESREYVAQHNPLNKAVVTAAGFTGAAPGRVPNNLVKNVTGELMPVYRGGNTFNILQREGLDYVVDSKTGFVTQAKGPSVNIDHNAYYVQKYGGAHQVTSVPKELQINLGKGGHAQIVPKNGVSLTPQAFQNLLNKIKTKVYGSRKDESH